MKLPVVDTSLPMVELFSPASNPLSNGLMEATLLLCWLLTVAHVLRALRRGDQQPLFVWSAILVYAVALEVITYNYVDSFGHQRFSVMLYHHKLPLYITFVYHSVVYASYHFARRLGLDPVPEAVVCGLIAMVMYTPYDLMGPEMGWWVWKEHLTTEARWMGVPYSSTLWIFLFHAGLCWLLGRRDPVASSPLQLTLSVAWVALATLVLGFLLFLPYHGLRFLGLTDGVILVLFIIMGVLIVALDQPQFRGISDRLILGVSILWHGFFLFVCVLGDLPAPVRAAAGALHVSSVCVQLVFGRLLLRPP